ncbi:hypothetical protein [Marivirga atlantica]|uniref:Type 1 periplasmic binding fold superfamily protein n=1 Tax=Marivirga atlantica TaxID=1548457 RepID=A0A937AGD7_9BACT|nr:hypothetical protein [Marivirga atlantica]MBL0766276.1 hypothetical protein [Marivirga atlantica]
MKKFNYLFLSALFVSSLSLMSCEDTETPEAENEEEVITDVTLTFTPEGGGAAVVGFAEDADGSGPGGLEVANTIALAANTTYELEIDLYNSIEEESISEEVAAEDEEHMFFFGFTEGLFTDPAGDGNIGADARGDALNYLDSDANNQPTGLLTEWTTAASGNGTFRVVLKHQPDIKSENSSSVDGSTDLNISWDITVN